MAIVKRIFVLCLLMAACASTASCTVVKIDRDAEIGKEKIISSGEKAVDLASYLEANWESALLPEINERRCDFAALLDEAKTGWEKAGEAYGVKKGDIGTKYNFIVHDTAVVKEINTESKAGFIVVELDGQPSDYTIKIAIGPVLKGTAIRDALKFIDFNQFVNQMDYAKLANELNKIGNDNVTQSVDIMALQGKTIEFTGCFTQPESDSEILVMPIFMEVK